VRQEPHFRRKEPDAAVVDQVVHPDVVLRDVLVRFRAHLRDLEVDLRRDALGEPLSEPGLGPLAARPAFAFRQTLFEGGQREVEQDDEGELVLEKVVGRVRGGVVSREGLVEGIDRSPVEVHLHPEVAVDLHHVSLEGLHRELHPLEQGVQRRGVSGEAPADELLEGLRVAVLRAPEARDLVHAPAQPLALPLAVLRDQLLFEGRPRSGESGARRRLRGRFLHLCRHLRARKSDRERNHDPRCSDSEHRHSDPPGPGV
jgi:hypothetical protein